MYYVWNLFDDNAKTKSFVITSIPNKHMIKQPDFSCLV